ncbi:hypothetical protein TRFO_38712 [Tritrichomonas foetus]|uniref:Uncharacterized protein n=1 Tax=Tritrichomonas foetus TaxID=1144522 RepID=A0A1J4JCU4_9EUKA|nr:hypothetical protein TRFO_38712 [Tritrichomonas foetus]|eukprot:OHS95092.1 hypothetical protein TRFO_38712 [Tritrichomonas foetus]
MSETPYEYINFSEVLFLQPKNTGTMPTTISSDYAREPQSARRKPKASSPRNKSSRKHELASHLQDSPYLKGPFTIRPPTHGEPSSARSVANNQNQRYSEVYVPPYIQRSSVPSRRKRSEGPPLLYQQRNKILSMNRNEFFKGLSSKYQKVAAMTPYGMDMTHYRECGLRRSARNRQEEEYEDMVETAATNRIKTQARLFDVQNDKRFHKDYMFNEKYPALRMIPVSDRIARSGDDSVIFI